MDALDLTLADKNAIGKPAGKIDDAVDGAVVLAVGLSELDAYPLACCESCGARIADDAGAGGDGDDGAEGRIHGHDVTRRHILVTHTLFITVTHIFESRFHNALRVPDCSHALVLFSDMSQPQGFPVF